MDRGIVVTAWNNGKHNPSGSGYGLRIPPKERDVFFNRNWTHVAIHLPQHNLRVEVNIAKKSFWKNCPELISREIGKWLRVNCYAPWPKGHPPQFVLRPLGDGEFELLVFDDKE